MSAVRLCTDEDASEQAVVRGLRARGIDVQTTADAGHLGATDAEQLASATAENRTIAPPDCEPLIHADGR